MENSLNHHRTIQDNIVVSMSYELRVDGGIVDKSEEDEPIQFIQGHGQIIPGLERQIYGMAIGEKRKVVVEPAEGYGEASADAYVEVSKTEIPPEVPMETGIALHVRDQQGQVMDAYIAEVRDEDVVLSFNHPLAGKKLHFSIMVVDLRDATEEEISHGHVHDSDWADEDEEDDYSDDFEEDEA